MKKTTQNNFAFIDSQNLKLAIRDQGWKLDFKKFYIYLREKFSVTKAFIFIGYVSGNEQRYLELQKIGYIIVFKPTLVVKKDGTIKGNVDAELVLHAMIEFENYEKAVIVSGDGDFHCLIEYLLSQEKLQKLIIPNKYKFSSLLRKFSDKIWFLNKEKAKLEVIKKEAQS
ncbi:MAG: NYN domain-containing protein [Rickettsiales bacterium]|nr:NYN domain-containing protein [Rickettsiales bacterium]